MEVANEVKFGTKVA